MKPETRKRARDDKSSPLLRRPDRWKVFTTVQPQGDAGVRWVQLTYVREPLPEYWPWGRRSS